MEAAADWGQQWRWRQQTRGSSGGSSRLEATNGEATTDWEVEVEEEEGQKVEGRQTGGSRLEAVEVEVEDWRQQRWGQ